MRAREDESESVLERRVVEARRIGIASPREGLGRIAILLRWREDCWSPFRAAATGSYSGDLRRVLVEVM